MFFDNFDISNLEEPTILRLKIGTSKSHAFFLPMQSRCDHFCDVITDKMELQPENVVVGMVIISSVRG